MKKINPAPFVFIILQCIILSICINQNRALIKFCFASCMLWISVIFTGIFYFITHLRDPGYVTSAEFPQTDISHNQIQKKQQTLHNMVAQNHQITTSNAYNPKSERVQEENLNLKPFSNPMERLDHEPSNEVTPKQIKSKQYQMQCEQSLEHIKIENDSKNRITSQIETNKQRSIQIQEFKIAKQKEKLHFNESCFVEVQSSSPQSIKEIQAKGPSNLDISQIVFMEKRYCKLCNLEQLLRSKHCKVCNRCIACYDHHCPWLGNCIGEKNKCTFYWFLVFQLCEILIVVIHTILIVNFKGKNKIELIVCFITFLVICFFFVMVFGLIIFHTYICAQNLTTWERLSWRKITYLKDFPQSFGSPFSRGLIQNLKIFCRFRVDKLTIWDFNQNFQIKFA